MADVDVKWDVKNGKFTVTPKDKVVFLKKYVGDKLVAYFDPVVKSDATGVIENVAAQTSFGEERATNKVKNPISEHSTIEKTIDTETKEVDKETKEKQLPNTGGQNTLQQIGQFFGQLFKNK